ncbi:acetylcholine receptor subunit beta-like 1 [Crassostrea virginica]
MMSAILVWVSCLFALVASYSVTDTTNLSSALLQNYNKNLRPGVDQSLANEINIDVYFLSLQEFSETSGLFASRMFFYVSWNDERLAWNPATYNGVAMMKFRQDTLWIPPLFLSNSYSNYKEFGSDKLLMTVFPSGDVRMSSLELTESTCGVDITKFPYDTQSCELQYVFLGYLANQVKFGNCTISMAQAEKSSLWTINMDTSISTSTTQFRNTMNLKFSFTRKSQPYTINIICPMVAIAILHITVFILPADSGERVGFSTTIILSITVYQTIVSDSLPNSTMPNLAFILYKLFVDFLVSICVHTLVVISLYFYLKDEKHDIPKFIDGFTRCVLRKRRNNKLKPIETPSVIQVKGSEKVDMMPENDTKEEVTSEITWKDVGKAWDVFSIILSLSSLLISNSIFFFLVM